MTEPKKSFYTKHHDRIWFVLTGLVLLFSFFVLGPLIQTNFVDNLKPYILIDANYMPNVLAAKAEGYSQCQIKPYTPIEIDGNPSGQVIRVPMDSVPQEYLPYVHYPENWDAWWNIYNPSQSFGPTLKKVLEIVAPILALLLLIYIFYLWKKGRLKGALSRILPHDKGEK